MPQGQPNMVISLEIRLLVMFVGWVFLSILTVSNVPSNCVPDTPIFLARCYQQDASQRRSANVVTSWRSHNPTHWQIILQGFHHSDWWSSANTWGGNRKVSLFSIFIFVLPFFPHIAIVACRSPIIQTWFSQRFVGLSIPFLWLPFPTGCSLRRPEIHHAKSFICPDFSS